MESTGGALSSLASIDTLDSSPSISRSEWEWGLGIFLCLAGAAGTNLGLTIQKLSFIRNDSAEKKDQRHAMRQPIWICGLAVFLLGQVSNLVAFGYTGQSLAATLGSFSLVTNGCFATIILGEKLTKTILISIAVIVSGSIIVVLASSHQTQDYTLAELITLYERDLFIGYMSILLLSFTVCIVLMWREHRRWSAIQTKLSAWESAHEARLAEFDPRIPGEAAIGDGGSPIEDPEMAGKNAHVTAGRQTKETDALMGEHRQSPPPELKAPPLTPITPIVAGAILSSLSVLFGKCTVQLVKSSVYDSNEFVHPLSWFLTIIFLVCATAAVVFLNLGLHRGTALFVVPLYYVLNTVLAILGGLIYFEEFQLFTLSQGLVFGCGVILTVVGVFVGSRGQVSEEDGTGEVEELDILSPTDDEVIQVTQNATHVTMHEAPPPPVRHVSPIPCEPHFGHLPKRGSMVRRDSSGSYPHPVGGTKVVRFGDGVACDSPSPPPPPSMRFVRAASEADVGLSDEEFRQLLAAEDAAAAVASEAAILPVYSSATRGASISRHPSLSTPQPTRYGSVSDSATTVAAAAGGAIHHPSTHRTPVMDRRSHTSVHLPRRIDLSRLTPAQQQIIHRRHAQLAAAGRRYSYNQAAHQASFAGEHQLGERRYSVAVLGLGVS